MLMLTRQNYIYLLAGRVERPNNSTRPDYTRLLIPMRAEKKLVRTF